MKPFHPSKVLRRAVRIRSSDRAIADADWVLTLSASGVRIHRYKCKAESWHLSWRSIVGHALVHGAGHAAR